MRILLFIVVALLPAFGYSQNNTARKIIDVHLHARSFDNYGNPPYPNPVTGSIPKWKNNAQVVQMTLDTLKKYQVVKAIVSGTLSRVQDFYQADAPRFIPSLDYDTDPLNTLGD